MRLRALLFFLLISVSLYAQEDFVTRLPIVIVNTDIDAVTGLPAEIPDEPKVGASMKIIYVDDTTVNHLSDSNNSAKLHYDGRIAIEIRGFTSQLTEKKSYGLETRKADNVSNNNVPLLGMPKEHDWILNGFYYEDSYLRDPLTYTLARRTGHYAPRTHYCELFLNGIYQGLYLFSEKIKQDKNRVNIKKMDEDDITEPAVTGGYIFKADRAMGDDSIAWVTNSRIEGATVTYVYHTPKGRNITPEQRAYIHDYFFDFMQAVSIDDTSETTGYPAFIDVQSFIDFMIVSELASNADIYQMSTFFHKDRNGKLCAGPVWDFNFAYGNDFLERARYDVWQFDNNDNDGSPFWKQLFDSPYYHRRLVARWHELTSDGGPLAYNSMMALVDSLEAAHYDAVPRDKNRWPNLIVDYDYHMWILRQWIHDRYQWLNGHLRIGIQDGPEMPHVTIAPNPTHDKLTITSHADGIELVEIYDIQGTLFISQPVDGLHTIVDLSHLPAGVYISRVDAGGRSVFREVVKLR